MEISIFVRTAHFWNNLHQVYMVIVKMIGNLNNLKSFVARKPKGLNID